MGELGQQSVGTLFARAVPLAWRRSHDDRMATYRAFGHEHGWAVLGMHQDLTYRYPVAPLLGARSAQADLALTGKWDHWPAIVASVLVRPAATGAVRRRVSDTVVQLTLLNTGPLGTRFVASRRSDRTDVALLRADVSNEGQRVTATLDGYAAAGSLQPGDHLGTHELGLVHARTLRPGKAIALEAPLQLLADFTASLVEPLHQRGAAAARGRPAIVLPSAG
jgi:hypothetical protein